MSRTRARNYDAPLDGSVTIAAYLKTAGIADISGQQLFGLCRKFSRENNHPVGSVLVGRSRKRRLTYRISVITAAVICCGVQHQAPTLEQVLETQRTQP